MANAALRRRLDGATHANFLAETLEGQNRGVGCHTDGQNDTGHACQRQAELAQGRKQRQQALSKAIRGLTYEEQAIFYRKYYYRQPTSQIASEYGTTERAIEGKLYRIKKKLRKVLGGGLFDE